MNTSVPGGHQRGFMAVELIFAIIAFSLLSALGARLLASRMDSQNYQIAAQQQQIVADAAARYIKDHYRAVLAAATPTVPAQITVEMLRNTRYLPEGFNDTNTFGQRFLVLARSPVPDQLESILITTGGESIDEIGTREIAENLGGTGGFIPVNKTDTVQGIRGGWQIALNHFGINPGVGHTASALFLQDGTLANDYLYRNAIPGKPELNRMNTALDMGNSDVTNAANISASGTVTAADEINTNTARIAGETYTGNWFRTLGDTGWYNEKWGGGWYMSDASWVRAYGDKSVYTPGQIRAGTLASEGRAEIGEYLQLIGVATENTACSPDGLIGRDSAGLTLSCQSGLWKGARAGPGKLANVGTYWGIVTRTNTSTSPIYVNAFGGNGVGGTCGNVYQMSAAVFYGSWITVSGSVHTYDLGSKSTSTGFMVPGGSAYRVSSYPFQCGAGVIYLTEFTP